MPTLSEILAQRREARREAERGLRDPRLMDPKRAKRWLGMQGGRGRRRGGDEPADTPEIEILLRDGSTIQTRAGETIVART